MKYNNTQKEDNVTLPKRIIWDTILQKSGRFQFLRILEGSGVCSTNHPEAEKEGFTPYGKRGYKPEKVLPHLHLQSFLRRSLECRWWRYIVEPPLLAFHFDIVDVRPRFSKIGPPFSDQQFHFVLSKKSGKYHKRHTSIDSQSVLNA